MPLFRLGLVDNKVNAYFVVIYSNRVVFMLLKIFFTLFLLNFEVGDARKKGATF